MSAAFSTNELTVRVASKTLLDRVSLAAKSGDIIALVGLNGAGKSTLLRTLAGDITPASGTVRIKEMNPAALSPRELALHRVMLSQHVTVTFSFTVGEIVRMGAFGTGPIADTIVEQALADVELEGFEDRIITTLSGGEQQRVHFARAMTQLAFGERAHGPGLLLLDEPTSNLDLRHQIDFSAAIRARAANGTTVLAVAHDLNWATSIAPRIVVLDKGAVVADGPPSETIKDSVLQSVFGVSGAITHSGPQQCPIVIPHNATRQ